MGPPCSQRFPPPWFGSVDDRPWSPCLLRISEGGPPAWPLDGKVAIVTGGGRGLGRAYARRLAALGAKITICDLSLKSFEEFEAESRDMTGDSTVAEIEAAGGSAFGVELDVADRAAVDAMVTQVAEKWARVDILVANAGGGRGSAPRYQGEHARYRIA